MRHRMPAAVGCVRPVGQAAGVPAPRAARSAHGRTTTAARGRHTFPATERAGSAGVSATPWRFQACATNGSMTMTTWADEYLMLLEDCERRSDKLSDWECGFVDSLQRQLSEGRRPTAKQIEALDRVWEKATARG